MSDDGLRKDYVDQIYVCSVICGDKHWYIKRGIWLFLLSVVAVELTIMINGAIR